MLVDKYKDYRDKGGRFTNGNPGRTSYSWLSGVEFKKQYSFLNIVSPNVCPDCGYNVFRFNIRWDDKKAFTVRCRCNNCNKMRWYKPYRDSWSSI